MFAGRTEFRDKSNALLKGAAFYSSLGGSVPVDDIMDLKWSVPEKLSPEKMEEVLKFEAETYYIANEVWVGDSNDLESISA